MINLWTGFDSRESIGHAVFLHSVWSRTQHPVSIARCPNLVGTDGTNAFTLSRFLVPYWCDYEGFALYMDGSDMLCFSDIEQLWRLRDKAYAVQVVKHDYKTTHPVKYLGEPNHDYPRKNWSSVMLINCNHDAWKMVNPATIKNMTGAQLHRFTFLRDELIGDLPPQWNYLCDEPNQTGPAKVAHFTLGLPIFPGFEDCQFVEDWYAEKSAMLSYKGD